jgi:hypothetical protein
MSVKWALLTCPSCKVRLRINADYLHLRGRCPECARRFPALRPQPAPPPVISTSDEPLGLAPEDEEWPEPAQIVADKTPYDIGAQPVTYPEPAPAEPTSPELGYALVAADPLTTAPPPIILLPTVETDLALEVLGQEQCAGDQPRQSERAREPALPLFGQESLSALAHEPTTRPPSWPLWQGVYSFPWQRRNLYTWLFLSFDICLIAVLAFGLFAMLQSGLDIFRAILFVSILVGETILLLPVGSYLANCFLAVVEATASGNERCAWPEGFNIIEGLETFFHLAWVCTFATLPIYFVVRFGSWQPAGARWWLPGVAVWLLIFPILLLSSLASESRWALLNHHIVNSLFKHPVAWLTLSAVSLGLALGCVEIGQLAIPHNITLLPVLALAAAASLLIYARLVGRVGWIVTRNEQTKVRRRTRKRNIDP